MLRMSIQKFEHQAMSTVFELMLATDEQQLAQSAAHKVFEAIDKIEVMFSRFLDASEVALISRVKVGETFRVSSEMMELLLIATRACAATNGAFDVTVGAVMDLLREVKHRWQAVDAQELDNALATCGMNRLQIDCENYLIAVTPDRLGRETPLELDFGAIAKGYALDKAAEMLVNDWDFFDFLMHGGTSTVIARGTMGDGQPGWPVGVGGDWQVRAGFDAVRLCEGAISGSGFEVKGAHVVDVRTGVAAARHAAAWSYAPSAAMSDALSTAFLGMSWREVKAACDALEGCGAMVARDQAEWMDKIRKPVQHYRFAGL